MTMFQRSALVFLLSFAAVAAFAQPAAMTVNTSIDAVRVTASAGTVQMRIEVFSSSGASVYDSNWQSGNLLDWTMPVLAYGSYEVRIQSKDLEGRVAEKKTNLQVAADRISLDPVLGNEVRLTTTAHDGRTGQLITTSGDLSFRFGDFLNRKDTEAMRLTAEGNLDVKGWVRPGQGILFSDGSVLTSAAGASIMRRRASSPPTDSADAKLHPKSDVSGTGTPNQVTKWFDTSGTLVDSAINEVGGAVRIGTIAAQGQLQIAGAANQDVFSGMGPNIVSGPAFNFGYGGLSFGVGAGFFNVRPAAGATGVNPSLRFMTINQERMIVTNAGDVGIGTSAPVQKLDVAGTVNVAGDLALPLTTSSTVGVITLGGSSFAHNFGSVNTFLGGDAGNFTMSGSGADTAVGYFALHGNTTGANNTAIGTDALYSNADGNANTASGVSALFLNINGMGNTASGFYALYNNTSGSYNTATGVRALFLNTTGYYNTGSGFQALSSNSTGNHNVASGDYALYSNTSGLHNIGIGDSAGYYLTTGDYNIDIGHVGNAAEANTIRIGTAGNQSRAFIAGIVGKTTGLPTAVPVLIDANGQLGTVASSRRYKFDIASMDHATDGLMRLRPVTFRYLAHGDNAPLQYGLIAEEVAEVYPQLVARNKDGEVETVMYQFLAPMLLNEVQKQHQTSTDQQKTIEALTTALAAVNARLEALEKKPTGNRQ
jgi:hypothetical protein